MKNPTNKIRSILALSGVILVVILLNLGVGFAEESDSIPTPTPENEQMLERVRNELNLTKADYRQLLNRISDTQARLDLLHEDKLTLQQQLGNIEDQITFTSAKLIDVISELVTLENEIRVLYSEIENREVAMEYQKVLLQDYIRVIYEQEKALFAVNEDGSIDTFKMLLAEGSVSEHIKQLDYLAIMNSSGQEVIDKLDKISQELEDMRLELIKKKSKLDILQSQLSEEKEQLELQKYSKKQLLKITLGQEKIYAQLLEQTADEQGELIADLRNLSNALSQIQDGGVFDESILDSKTRALYDFQIDSKIAGRFDWPVDPELGISAYFRDPSYVGVFGVQHNAVDIPEYQGSPIRAAGDAVVYTVKDNGYGYSYVILAHAGGLTSVYGHVSNILVEEGQTVPRGFVIAMSGGMPGTKGAGYMTTGPHLHLEMLRNGLHVDPLDYLPLGILDESYIENLPQKYQDRWNSAIFSESLSR